MKSIIKYFLITLLFTQYSFAVSSKYYQDKFNDTKKLYLGAIMSSDKKKEIEYLKKLIRYGDKLKINTYKYKQELNRLDKNSVLKKPIKTKSHLKSKYTIKSVRQDRNSITITFNHRINKSYIKFIEKKDKKYHYDQFEIRGSFKDANPTKLSMKGISKISIYQHKKNLLHIVFKNRKKSVKTIYIIKRYQIIIKVLDKYVKSNQKKKAIKNEVKFLPSESINNTNKIIVIDAGHGGKDPGAISRSKVREKDVVLNISLHLRRELKKKGFTVYLTRNRNKYVRLPNRTKYANRKKADIFISIHANAARKSRASKAHGVETYFLSPARSERAKRVAALENKGDFKKMNWSSKNSLLTILNQSKITESNKIAVDIQRNMLHSLRGKYGKKAIRDGGVREGPFWVLVGAQMPSVLVEVGYISHPVEGRRISTRKYQQIIAKGIANGVESYFIKN